MDRTGWPHGQRGRRGLTRGRVRFLVALAASVAVLLAANGLAALFASHLRQPLYWPTFEIQHKYARMQQLGRSGTRVLLVGDSVLDSAADPARMAASGLPGVFNAALAGEPLATVEEWMLRILASRFHPGTVVLGFDLNVLNGGLPGQAALLTEFHHSRPVAVAEGRGDAIDRLDGWLDRHVAIYRERSVLRQPFQPPTSAGAAIYDPPLSGTGWNEDFRSYELGASPGALNAAAAALRGDLFAQYRQSVHDAATIASAIRLLEDHGVAVVFVALPQSPALRGAVPGGQPQVAAGTDAMLAAAGRAGARVLDAGPWSASYFADGVHLNQAGTTRFSQWLAGELETRR